MERMESKGTSEKGMIFIKKEAFRNMLTHVLRFGNESLEKSVEVMGICLGHYESEEDKVIVENAVPLSHGDKVEIGFDKDDYDLFIEIKNKYSLDLIGYYHSHPSWGLFLSESDLNNLKYFQSEKFPYGFAIVFDHTLMGKNEELGFEIYRLDDFSKAEKYHNIQYEIEKPTSIEYYKWVQKFSEDIEKKNPILIKEVNELDERPLKDLQEIPIIEEPSEIDTELKNDSQMKTIISGFQQGTETFSREIIEMLNTQMGDWIDEMNQGTSRGTEYIVKALSKMKEVISSGLGKVDNWFKRTLDETVTQFEKNVSNYVDSRIDANKELKEYISKFKDKLIKDLKISVEKNIDSIEEELKTLRNSIAEKTEESKKIFMQFDELVNNYKRMLTNTNEQINELSGNIERKIQNSLLPLQKNLDEKIEKLNTELTPFKENNSEIKSLLEKLQKIITSFRNLH
ncbi:MAG: hypothetical protein ACFFC3_01450 [Candidatus Odinarchaeota archaeon]